MYIGSTSLGAGAPLLFDPTSPFTACEMKSVSRKRLSDVSAAKYKLILQIFNEHHGFPPRLSNITIIPFQRPETTLTRKLLGQHVKQP